MGWFGKATCPRPARKETRALVYHYIREAKRLLLIYIQYTLVAKSPDYPSFDLEMPLKKQNKQISIQNLFIAAT